ncbi:MAG TPA: SMP-30/gluconolactonase/LRE family protein [Clostridia bacterium]|nr:SMP-30/gluconolactonase/LRE family protein [Clostridia bacterium]
MVGKYVQSGFSLVINANVELAETPIWDARINKWYWTDLFSGDVHRFDPVTGSDELFKTDQLIGSAIPTNDVDILMVSLQSGLHLLDLSTGKLTFIIDPENGNPNNRYNDTRVDARGRVFMSSVSKLYGTDDYSPDMLGGFYMVDTDKSVTCIEQGINQFNAIVWNSDSTRMLVVDTYNQTLLCYDYDINKGPIGPGKVVIRFGALGMPDGINIDVEDNIYVCHWTGRMSVWDKEFNHVDTIKYPVEFACCGGFGGEDMKDFYVASSKYKYTKEDLNKNPGAGGIFSVRSEIAGMPDHFYKI